MKISYGLLPDYPLTDSSRRSRSPTGSGSTRATAADETWHKDLWCLICGRGRPDEEHPFGAGRDHVFLREPTMVCQAMATLDELTGGRTELVYSIGNFAMLDQYGLDWAAPVAVPHARGEARDAHVPRRGRDRLRGRVLHVQGDVHLARPVQERMPIKIGAMRGPKSFEFAGEVTDGHAPGAGLLPRGERVRRRERADRRRAGRPRLEELDIGAWWRRCVAEDSDAAKRGACACWWRSTSPRCRSSRSRATGSGRETQPIFEAFGSGDVEKAIELTTPDLVEKLSFAGTPEESSRRSQDIEPAGMNHMILSLGDPTLVQFFSGQTIEGVPPITDAAAAGGRAHDPRASRELPGGAVRAGRLHRRGDRRYQRAGRGAAPSGWPRAGAEVIVVSGRDRRARASAWSRRSRPPAAAPSWSWPTSERRGRARRRSPSACSSATGRSTSS